MYTNTTTKTPAKATDGKNKPPVFKTQVGGVFGTLWQNESEKGNYFTATVHRSYKDKAGQWQKTDSMRINDLPCMAVVCDEMFKYAKMKGGEKDEPSDE